MGDCTKILPNIADSSIHLIVTSPPYFLNKSYEKDWTFANFEQLMKEVFKQARRVLVPGGYMVVNFGDCYNSGNRFYDADVPSVFPASIWYWNWGREEDFDLQSTRIWRKQFAKMAIPFVCNSHPRNIFDYEHIWTWRKKNGLKNEVVHDRKLSQRGVLGETWSSSAKIDQHCAAFPLELPQWAISVYSREGDMVLDPFLGSGTTGIAAKLLKRDFIGIEVDADFYALAEKNINRIAMVF